ncbi:hypothetical protein Gogos_021394 [Gossypium gossypioides]|uniref:Uncharacterized protein n=1 Tax=Gossypium gossypioides TaxID=34282 RepID=A0A7J9D7H4_GOSGO|nr:hypothetical protein [Gossypium gossypioides]
MIVTSQIMLNWSRHPVLIRMLKCHVHIVQKLWANGLV